MKKMPYSKEELYSYNSFRSFSNKADKCAFLLGGIGTGNISLYSSGRLKDYEIFNQAAKNSTPNYSFFSIYAKKENCSPVCKLLEAKNNPPYATAYGYWPGEMAGLPKMDSSEMHCEYPFANVNFNDKSLPVEVKLTAFTPFIPLNVDDSAIPAFIMRYTVKNTSDCSVDVSIAASMENCLGNASGISINYNDRNISFVSENGISSLYYTVNKINENAVNYSNMAISTSDKNVTYCENWLRNSWWDGLQTFWDDFKADGKLEKPSYEAINLDSNNTKEVVGSLGIYHTIQPGEEKDFEFVISWYNPNRVDGWWADKNGNYGYDCETVKVYYCTLFSSSLDAAKHLINNINYLESHSKSFSDALFKHTTLPDYVIESIAANITVIRSQTCFMLSDGTFLAFEGTGDNTGSCHGNCTHVWNYEQTLAFLFPSLARNMRETEFLKETKDNGYMGFRVQTMFSGLDIFDYHPAADGQLGTIIRLYREFMLSGDDEFLKKVWPKAKKALDFAFDYWDSDKDFVLDKQQHNTYDIEFYGPNSLTNSMFFAALHAGEKICRYLGDSESADKYKTAYQLGSKRMDEYLYNGEYYIQKLDNVDEYRYQYGKGCLSDMLLGQQLAHISDLGYVLNKEHVKSSVYSIFKYNFLTDFSNHENCQRAYVLNDEKGLLLCSWPNGGRPKLPFVYSDEVWTGIEHQVAVHLIYEGYIDEGLTIIKAIRERQDGYKRNPFNEVECGHHYARSLASWGALIALSGYKFNLAENKISFDPKINKDNFECFYSNNNEWGIYSQKTDKNGNLVKETKVLYSNK